MPAYRTSSQPNFAGFSVERFMRWRPSLAIWGAGVGIAASLYLSDVPLFQKDVLRKIPGVAEYFTDRTPDSDKPF